MDRGHAYRQRHRFCSSFGLRYRRAWHSFKHNLRDVDEAARHLQKVAKQLHAFVDSWRPTGLVHNDFYDDQMIVLPDGRISLVDFEAIALGDPLLDVGNFLAHLRWSVNVWQEIAERSAQPVSKVVDFKIVYAKPAASHRRFM